MSLKFRTLRISQPHHIAFSLVGSEPVMAASPGSSMCPLLPLVLSHHAFEPPVLEAMESLIKEEICFLYQYATAVDQRCDQLLVRGREFSVNVHNIKIMNDDLVM